MQTPLSVVTSDDHRSHDPEFDIYAGSVVGSFEVPQRVDRIRDALADGPFLMTAPTCHGLGPVLRVHNPDLVDFLSTAWKEYTSVVSDPQIVIGELFNHEGLVEGMAVGRPPATDGYGRTRVGCV